jgi:hypothetical protein
MGEGGVGVGGGWMFTLMLNYNIYALDVYFTLKWMKLYNLSHAGPKPTAIGEPIFYYSV